MAMIIGNLMNLKHDDIEKIHIAAHLHDIGKIGVPDHVLNKEGKLDELEWELIKAHPVIGANILNRSSKLSELSDIVLYHHERYDGLGYPYGLSGVSIPIGARIIALCDSIDAMTTRRSYRNAFDFKYAYGEIERNLGSMYDPFIGKFVLDNWHTIVKPVLSLNNF